MSILSEERITHIICECDYTTHSDKWLMARHIEREVAEACAMLADSMGSGAWADEAAHAIREANK